MAAFRPVAISTVVTADTLNYRTCSGGGVEVGLNRNAVPRMLKSRNDTVVAPTLELSSSFTGTWHGRRPSAATKAVSSRWQHCKRKKCVMSFGGIYEDGFNDVERHIMNYFTYKAVRTVLHQLYEMNPPGYMWLYRFAAENKPADGKRFLRALTKENQELGERVMITRLNLYSKWIKKCDHSEMYQKISDENLELMRERLLETIAWPSDDTNTEKVG